VDGWSLFSLSPPPRAPHIGTAGGALGCPMYGAGDASADVGVSPLHNRREKAEVKFSLA